MLILLMLLAITAVVTACLLMCAMCEMRADDKARQGYWKNRR